MGEDLTDYQMKPILHELVKLGLEVARLQKRADRKRMEPVSSSIQAIP